MNKTRFHLSERSFYQLASVLAGVLVLLGVIYLLAQPHPVLATSGDLSTFNNKYPGVSGSRISTCSLCHTSNIPSFNAYGLAYRNNGSNSAALTTIENLDSDGDGFTNLQEIVARSFPGNADDRPAAVATATNTSVPPTATATRTNTSVAPSATATATRTNTSVAPTNTAIAPSATPTNTSVAPTATPTGSVVVPTATPSATVVPASGLDLDIMYFVVKNNFKLGRKHPLTVRLNVKNRSRVTGDGIATIVGVQNGVEVYRQTLSVTDAPGDKSTRYMLPTFMPTEKGTIHWTATLSDDNSDNDVSTERTRVTGSNNDDDDDDDDKDDEDKDDEDDDRKGKKNEDDD